MEKTILKDITKAFLIITVFIVSIGFGTLITLLIVSIDSIAKTPYENITIIIDIFFMLLLWLSLMFILRNSIIFIMFNTPLYLAILIQSNSYYPYITLLFIITIIISIILRNRGGKFAYLPRVNSWICSKRFL